MDSSTDLVSGLEMFAPRAWKGIRRKPWRAATSLGVLVALLALTVLVGWVWFGWGYIANNEELLDSLPVPPRAERISINSTSYSSHELAVIPPDGWSTRGTYRAHPQTTKDDIVDFYVSQLSLEWEPCQNYVNSVDLKTGEEGKLMTGVHFTRGQAYVGIDILNMTEAPHTFDVGVDHNEVDKPCD